MNDVAIIKNSRKQRKKTFQSEYHFSESQAEETCHIIIEKINLICKENNQRNKNDCENRKN